jgi:transcriptional regulator with XRE-family HTH domain
MKSDTDLFFINKIRKKRKEWGMSQRGLAAIPECSVGFVGQVESEKYIAKYSIHQLYIIAQHFGCSPADFFPPVTAENL